VTGEPPSLAGAVNATVACMLPAVTMPIVGAPGTVAGVTLPDAADAGLSVGVRVFHQKFGYGEVRAADGDKLEIVHFVGGGSGRSDGPLRTEE